MLHPKRSVLHFLSPWQLVLGIAALAFALRAAAVILFADHHVPELEYMLIAQNLLDGKGFWWNDWGRMPWQFTSLFPPLYVYFCAAFMVFSPTNYLPLYFAQAAVGALGCLPAYVVGRDFFSPRTGILFALLFAVYPEFVFLPVRPVPEFAHVVLCLVVLALFARWRQWTPNEYRTLKLAAFTGLIGGVGMLMKETIIIPLIAIAMSYTWTHRRSFVLSLTRVVLPIFVVAFLALVPWGIRNRVVQGEWIFMRSAFGLNLWMGNNEIATGTDKTGDGGYIAHELYTKHQDYYDRVKPADEQDIEQFYVREATGYIRKYQAHYLELTGRRLLYLLWFDPTHRLAQNVVYRLSYVALLMLAIPGFYLAWRQRKLDPVWPLILLGHIALYVPVIIVPRYRIMMIVVYALFAAWTVNSMLYRIFQPDSYGNYK